MPYFWGRRRSGGHPSIQSIEKRVYREVRRQSTTASSFFLLCFQALAKAMSAEGRLPDGREAEEPVQLALVGRPNVGKAKRR